MNSNKEFCKCGSGKQKESCCESIQKATTLTVDMGKPTVVSKFSISENGEIQFFEDDKGLQPISAELSQYNKRASKKDKVTLNAPITSTSELSLDLYKNLMQLDYLFIIDTNTKKIDVEKRKSVSIMQYFKRNGNELRFVNGHALPFEHNDDIHGEKIGLVELIKFIINNLKIPEHLMVGIVTDHDLGNHKKFNSREIPLIEGTSLFLPKNFCFIYASADKKNSSILSKLISECDKEATKFLKNTFK